MSCGNHHDVPCVEVLSLMWVYIDNEIDDGHRVEVTVHLQECPPCADHFTAEQIVQARIRRCCTEASTPEELRSRIVSQIQANLRSN